MTTTEGCSSQPAQKKPTAVLEQLAEGPRRSTTARTANFRSKILNRLGGTIRLRRKSITSTPSATHTHSKPTPTLPSPPAPQPSTQPAPPRSIRRSEGQGSKHVQSKRETHVPLYDQHCSGHGYRSQCCHSQTPPWHCHYKCCRRHCDIQRDFDCISCEERSQRRSN